MNSINQKTRGVNGKNEMIKQRGLGFCAHSAWDIWEPVKAVRYVGRSAVTTNQGREFCTVSGSLNSIQNNTKYYYTYACTYFVCYPEEDIDTLFSSMSQCLTQEHMYSPHVTTEMSGGRNRRGVTVIPKSFSPMFPNHRLPFSLTWPFTGLLHLYLHVGSDDSGIFIASLSQRFYLTNKIGVPSQSSTVGFLGAEHYRSVDVPHTVGM